MEKEKEKEEGSGLESEGEKSAQARPVKGADGPFLPRPPLFSELLMHRHPESPGPLPSEPRLSSHDSGAASGGPSQPL